MLPEAQSLSIRRGCWSMWEGSLASASCEQGAEQGPWVDGPPQEPGLVPGRLDVCSPTRTSLFEGRGGSCGMDSSGTRGGLGPAALGLAGSWPWS